MDNKEIKKVLILGGAGYVGSTLAWKLRVHRYKCVIYDTFWFGDHINVDCQKIKGDIRDIDKLKEAYKGVDAVIHLAGISLDVDGKLKDSVTKSINLDSFRPLVEAAKHAGVQRFIFASSSSVYGYSDDLNIEETHKLAPKSLYNIYKAECEKILMEYADDNFCCTVIRPATLCGDSKRMRIDTILNAMCHSALTKKVITVYGGKQIRPLMHVDDCANALRFLLLKDGKEINSEVFNLVTENLNADELANRIKSLFFENRQFVELKHIHLATDNRSYHISNKKIEGIGFNPTRSIVKAIQDVVDFDHIYGWDDKHCINIDRYLQLGLNDA